MRRRSRALDYAVYLLVRVVVCFVQAMSWETALHFAGFLGWLMHRFNGRHRQVALENLEHAFPQLDRNAHAALVQDCYGHLATMIVEMIRLPRLLHRNTLDTHVQIDSQVERVFGWIRQRSPLIAVTGHIGNWEVLNYVAGLYGCQGASVARGLDNPYLHQFLTRFRRNTGQIMLDKSGDARRMIELLRGGGWLGILGDQDAGPRGLFVDYFGRPASSFKSIAQLALEHDARIAVMAGVRVGHPMRYQLVVEDVIEPGEYAKHPDATRAITQRYTHALERIIRRYPEQYFWLHRRWKHQPVERRQAA